MEKFVDLIGQKFGRLTVLHRIENTKYGSTRWHCKCDCGNECDVSGNNLRKGHTQSCGCIRIERLFVLNSNINQNEYKLCDDYIIAKTSTGVEFYVDQSDEWIFKKYHWFTNHNGYLEAVERECHKKVLIHRLIVGCPNDMIVDHIDGNPLNNRKSNLRIVTRSQNCMNRELHSNNTSSITGVNFHKQSSKWNARIMVNNKRISLGLYDNFDDAVAARKAAEEKYFGEYSYDNSRRNVQHI